MGSVATTVQIAWYRQPWIVSLATAAAVLLAVGIWQFVSPPQSQPVVAGWGWNRPGNLSGDVSAPAYLNQLADAAQEWFKQRPEGSADLARRIGEFRQGCSQLILAKHRPLSEADRAWLVERCRAWAGKLDAHLADVESGKDVAQVRSDTDATVRQLIDALRKRAESA